MCWLVTVLLHLKNVQLISHHFLVLFIGWWFLFIWKFLSSNCIISWLNYSFKIFSLLYILIIKPLSNESWQSITLSSWCYLGEVCKRQSVLQLAQSWYVVLVRIKGMLKISVKYSGFVGSIILLILICCRFLVKFCYVIKCLSNHSTLQLVT